MIDYILGWWKGESSAIGHGASALKSALEQVTRAFTLLDVDGEIAVTHEGRVDWSPGPRKNDEADGRKAVLAHVAPCPLESLGDPSFCRDYELRYPIVAGAMYRGITGVDMVEAMGRAGMIGFFGAGGLSLKDVDEGILELQKRLGNLPFGVNLLYSPQEPEREDATVDLFLRRGISIISASAYLDLSLPLLRYRCHGIHVGADGKIVTPNRVVAKVSRREVASKFFAPPPRKYLDQLVKQGHLTPEQAELAEGIPVAQDLTAEADSGGHTDNRPFITLLPTMIALRDEMQARHGYDAPLRVGAAGGIGTPSAMASAFAMGAAYVLLGSIPQSCVEAGMSEAARKMLAETRQAEVTMAPAADMFEMGVKVQVLKKGTMFPMRANKLYELYRDLPGLDAIPVPERTKLEKTVFGQTLEQVWSQTAEYFQGRDPSQVERAQRDPKHKMALVFRWYLDRSSRWAIGGDEKRKIDYQVHCGPAMGSFNEWASGSHYDRLEARKCAPVALDLLLGAAALTRANGLRAQGLQLPIEALRPRPHRPEELASCLDLNMDGLA